MGVLNWVLLQFVIFEIFTVSCHSYVPVEVWALTAFKEAIYDDPYLVLSNWNNLDATPCKWYGVTCSRTKHHVLKLNISGSALKGFIAPELGRLSHLQELYLHGNKLIGIIPREIGKLKNLRVLDLGANQISGMIPHEIGDLSNIAKLNLQSNRLTGMLPIEIGNLRNLQELRLDRNKLQGIVPGAATSDISLDRQGKFVSNGKALGLCRSLQLKFADFSFNFFVGSVPKCLLHLPSSSFLGNCLKDKGKQRPQAQCGALILSKPRSNPNVTTQHKPFENQVKHQKPSRPTWLLALEIATGCMAGILLIAAILTSYKKCNSNSYMTVPWKKSRSGKDRLALYIDPELLKDIVRFTRQELDVACEDFSNVIGSSSESMIYKGTMKCGSEIAVISFCIKEEQWSGYHELYFRREVAILARLNHENVAKLMGYCRENPPFTRMLVFEYASNGTLYEHLHSMFADGEGCQLSWTRRMKIILGIARGLRYLHTELNPPFTISELNSNSVYLTEDFSPKLVDFESWKTIIVKSKITIPAIDCNGYIGSAPRSSKARHLDMKGNIYAFGVLLLEIVTGRPPFCKDTGSLVNWAREYLEIPEVMPYMVDKQLKHFEYKDLKAICEAATLCLNPDPVKRPVMQDLCTLLESHIDTSLSAELKSSSMAWAEVALLT